MKKRFRKMISMLLAAAMVLSMGLTGLAAEIDPLAHSGSDSSAITGSITINNAASGEIYSIYKIFDMTYEDSGDGKTAPANASYSYKVVSEWKSFIEDYEYASDQKLFILDANGYLTSDSAVFSMEDDSEVMAAFARAALAYAQETVINATDSKKADANLDGVTRDSDGKYSVEFSGLDLGYYLIDTSLGSLCFINSTNPDAAITEKNGYPSVSKFVHENTAADDVFGGDDDVDNNDDILFQIIINNINGAVNLVLHDSMDDELEIPNKSNFDMESVDLYTSSTSSAIALTEGTDYTVSVGECTVTSCNLDNCAFEVAFSREFNDVDATGYIELTYKLHLNTDNDIFEADEEKIENCALVTFGTSADSQSEEAKAETWSFGFEVYKYTGIYGGESETALADADFELTKGTGNDAKTAYFKYETLTVTDEYGQVSSKTLYMFEGWYTDNDTIPTGYTSVLKSASDGMIYIEGLDAGTYTLSETKAPDGYNLLTYDLTVNIVETKDSDGLITGHIVTYFNNDSESDPESAYLNVISIQNNSGSILPSTGGMGTTIFYIVGIVLMIGAAAFFVARKRISKEE